MHRSVLLLALAIACAPRRPSSDLLTLHADTLLQAGNDRVSRPLDLVVGSQGELFLADMGTHTVTVLGPDGSLLRTIGREGSGPGEILIPRSLAVTADTLRLVDAGNSRIVVFDTAGRFVRTLTGLPALNVAGVAFSASGGGLLARHGVDSSLARHFAPDGSLGSGVGVLRVTPTYQFDFAAIKADLAAERVPQGLRNHSYPVLGPQGDAWILLLVDGAVQHLSALDSLLWDVTLPDTVIGPLRQAIYARARADSSPNRFPFPTLFVMARPVRNDLWLLLKEPDGQPARIGVLDSHGRWARWIRIIGATDISAFDVDPATNTVYLLDGSEGTLLRARVPGY